MDRRIQSLLGPVTDGDLQYVDVYVGRSLGIFIPSVGHCGLATREGHTHPSFSLIVFPDFRMDFLFGGKFLPGPEEYLATAISPRIPHEEPAGEEFVSYLAIMVGEELYDRIAAEFPVPRCESWHPFFVPKSTMPLIQMFMAEVQKERGGILLDSLESAVAVTLLRYLAGADTPVGKGAAAHSTGIRTAIDHINQHYGQKLTAQELAKLAAMSSSSFSRIFRRETGRSPMQFLIEVRLEKARKLLADSKLSITETALHCGFHSTSHLTTCFKQQYGLTPSAFRQGRIL